MLLQFGHPNITDKYDLNYFWYDYSQGGRPVGEGQEYPLPASVYGKKATLLTGRSLKRTYSGWTPRPQRFCTAS